MTEYLFLFVSGFSSPPVLHLFRIWRNLDSFEMKHLLLTTIAAVVLVGCGPNIHEAAKTGNIKAVKQHLDAGADVNAKDGAGRTPLDKAKRGWLRDSPEVIAARKETADLLRKHGGKTAEELKAAGN